MRLNRRANNGEIEGPDGGGENPQGVAIDKGGAAQGDAQAAPVIRLPVFPHSAPGGAD